MSANELYLEPMTAGMILDRTFRLYTKNFALMIGVTALVQLPLLAVTVLAPLVRESSVVLGVLATLIWLFTFLASFLILTPLVTGAATKAISERYLGNEITVGAALKFSWGYVWTLLLIHFVVGIIVTVGTFLFVIPGVFFWLSYILVVPVTVLENIRDGNRVRQRSWDLVTDHRWKVFAVVVVLIVPQFVLSISGPLYLQYVFGMESALGEVMGGLLSGLMSLLLYPLQAIAITLLYYDLRIRKEGFDLEILSREIAGPETLA
jgi:hypothetical protein